MLVGWVIFWSVYFTFKYTGSIAYAGGMGSKPVVAAGVEYVTSKSACSLENAVVSKTTLPWVNETLAVKLAKTEFHNMITLKKHIIEQELIKDLATYNQIPVSDIPARAHYTAKILSNKELLATLDSAKVTTDAARAEFFDAVNRAATEQAAVMKTSVAPKPIAATIKIRNEHAVFPVTGLQPPKVQNSLDILKDLAGSSSLESVVDNRSHIYRSYLEWHENADHTVSMKRSSSMSTRDNGYVTTAFDHLVNKHCNNFPIEQKLNQWSHDNLMPDLNSRDQFIKRFKNSAHLSAAQQKKAAWEVISQAKLNPKMVNQATSFWRK